MDRAIEIIAKAIGVAPGKGPVRRVLVEPTADSEGRDALSVTLILDDDSLSGPDAGVIVSDVQDALAAAGDERFPIIEFATEEEMAFDGGSQF